MEFIICLQPALWPAASIIGRVIRELPWLSMQFMHVQPELIAYCVSELVTSNEQSDLTVTYIHTGFVCLNGNSDIYAYEE